MCLGDFVACGKAGLEIVLASPWMCRAEHRWQTSEHDGSVPDAKLGSRPKEWAYGRGSRMQIAATAAHFCNGSTSEVGARDRHVRFPPDSDKTADIAGGPFRAKLGHQSGCYSMTSSARASNDGGTVNPSALAALTLIASSNFVGICTGSWEGFSPLRIRST